MGYRSTKKFGKQRDAAEPAIVQALEAAGASIEYQEDFDLLVGVTPWCGPYANGLPHNFRLEVKTPKPPPKLTSTGKMRNIKNRKVHRGWSNEDQKKKFEEWRGQKAIVWTAEMALIACGLMRSTKRE